MAKKAEAMEELLALRLKYEQGLANCSRALLMMECNFRCVVNNALLSLLEATEVSRVYIFENEEDAQLGTCMSQTFEVCAPGVSPEIANPALQRLPYEIFAPRWQECLSRGEPLGGVVETFPQGERDVLEPQGILSLLVIPLFVSGNWFGFIGFDDTVNRHEWSEDDVRLLRTAADMIGAFFERNRAMETLQFQHAQLLSIFDSIDEIVYVADIDTYEILFANKFLTNALGKDPVGLICYEEFQRLDRPCDFCTNEKLIKSKGVSYKWEHFNPVINKRYLLCDQLIRWPDGRDVRFELAIDITERVKLREEQNKAARLESIGILASGIAHDFNNILTSVLGNVSLAGMIVDENPATSRELLAEVEKACFNARGLTRQLLTFSKGGQPVVHTTMLGDLITESAGFALSGSKTRCRFTIADNLWPGDVDSGQIAQVINNMVINADHAMPEGGEIVINAENVVVKPDEIPSLKPGEYVRIDIIDSGHGIPEKYLTRIFDPYFSTKQQGHGLGLATSHSIIQKHGGAITVESSSGNGAAFHIYLPASSQKASAADEEAAEPVRTGAAAKAKVLVMDDEDMISTMIMKYLTGTGYEVDTACDGAEALLLYGRARMAGAPYDVVILDLTVPGGMGGKETFDRMRELDPDVRAIIFSGYSSDPVIADYSGHGFKAFLKKPFQLSELKTALQEAVGNDC